MQRSNSPLPGHDAQSNARGMPGGGMLKFRIDRRISVGKLFKGMMMLFKVLVEIRKFVLPLKLQLMGLLRQRVRDLRQISEFFG